ncbi:acyltransferase [Bifidobacterium dolichotidis]|uniref:Acyltransferase n=1 Tax=Bifidobacterium dolichotidis TaxID=2306976 RepID=A0A430FQB9_9BIFI|nr:acyltransferase family protein [Bifidobacterium dolichotidis]RSX55027.1 acyltransferase [Bifidobacterium dolichotidis]
MPKQNHHIVAVDGLRALAILGVLAYHTRPALLSGGLLGVTVFFVLSGFFTTRGLLRRFSGHHFNFPKLYLKRLKRLWPAVLTTVALVAPATYLASPSLLHKVQQDALPSAVFASNWVYIARHSSYFEAAGLPSPLTHLWYTSLIMQFAIIWPLMLAGIMLVCKTRIGRLAWTAGLIVVSTVEMSVMAQAGLEISRMYYGLDTRLGEILVGAFLAILLADEAQGGLRAHEPALPPVLRRLGQGNAPAWLGLAMLVILGAAFVLINGRMLGLYEGGFLVTAIATAILLWSAMKPTWLSRALGCKPLQYLGSRSFSLYLVHYPLLEFMNPATRVTKLQWWEWIVQFAIILIFAELFYQFIEAVRGTPLVPWVSREIQSIHDGQLRPGAIAGSIIGAVMALVLAFAPIPWESIAQTRAEQLRPELKQSSQTQPTATPTVTPKPEEQPAKPQVQAAVVPKNLDADRWHCTPEQCDAHVLVVGDSVTEGARPALQQAFPQAVIDAQVSRSFLAGIGIVRDQVAATNPQLVVVALGANDLVTEDELNEMLDAVDGRPLYLITPCAPVEWVDPNVTSYFEFAKKHPNVGIIDWHATAASHIEYLVDDGTHLTPAGMEGFAQLIKAACCPQ